MMVLVYNCTIKCSCIKTTPGSGGLFYDSAILLSAEIYRIGILLELAGHPSITSVVEHAKR
jgi:hypothetical protein